MVLGDVSNLRDDIETVAQMYLRDHPELRRCAFCGRFVPTSSAIIVARKIVINEYDETARALCRPCWLDCDPEP